jgi:hypothetical protein
LEFFPVNNKTPLLSEKEAAIAAADALTEALTSKKPSINLDTLRAPGTAALQHLNDVFQQKIHTNTNESTDTLPRVASPPRVTPPPRVAPDNEGDVQCNTNEPIAARTRSGGLQQQPHNLWANAVLHPVTGKAMEYRKLITDPVTKNAWLILAANEYGRLMQGGGGRVKGTDTMHFIKRSDIPSGRTSTYPRFVCEERPQKKEVNRTRLTLGGNLIDYPGDVSTRTAEMDTIKILLNSVVSTPEAKFCGMDITNFYLDTPLDRYEYVRIPINLVPSEIIDEYKVKDKVTDDGFIYAEIRKGMYGLPQAGILANKLLKARLEPHGYTECIHTPGLWRHNTRPIMFALVVDDFAVQYTGREHAQHLLAALKQDYEAVTVDWDGKLFCGITLEWDYLNRTVDLSMPGYVADALAEFQHETPVRDEHQPHRHNAVQYGVKTQMTDPIDDTELLNAEGNLRLQRITGKFQYYCRAVDPTMNVALSSLASQQTKGTQQTAQDAVQFLNYCATHPDAKIRYRKSDMILKIQSDASYLSEPKARSRSGGHCYIGNHGTESDTNNGVVLATTAIMKTVLSSAAEAEIAALFENAKKATILRTTLMEMGYPQPVTPIQTDNSTACSFANDTIKQQRSRAIDMCFYLVRDRVKQGHFHIYWGPGQFNLAAYYTKHHAAAHHQRMRPIYLHTNQGQQVANAAIANALYILRGCVKPAPAPARPVTAAGSTIQHVHVGNGIGEVTRTRTQQTNQQPIRASAHSLVCSLFLSLSITL